MPRIRSVKPEFFSSEPVGNCSPTSRLLFVALWCYADDDGRCVDNAKVIRAFAFPLDDEIRSADVGEMLAELHAARLLVRYVVDGRNYLAISNFTEHQHPKKRLKSKLPPPPVVHQFPTPTPPVPPVVVVGVVEGEGVVEGVTTLPIADAMRPAEDRRARPRPAAPNIRPSSAARYPGFPADVCDAAHQHWQAKVGSVEYPRFRKAFGPLFSVSEAARAPDLPRDAELVPAIALYLAACKGTREAQFRSPERCAASLSGLVRVMRLHPDDGIAREAKAQIVLGIHPQRQAAS
jgi:hypothetical protein